MGVISNYYLNGATLTSSTGVYMDADLVTCAPVGHYSDGVIVRYLDSNCVLGPSIMCPSCEAPCGPVSIVQRGTEGVYNTTVSLGSGTGAVIITFKPGAIPDGIYASYNSVIYNALSSQVDGYHKTATSSGVTYLGDQSSGSCATDITTNSPYVLPEYTYSGGSFALTGSSESVIIAAADVSLSVQDPKDCVMVIPKLTAAPASLLVSVINFCKSGSWELNIACPSALSSTIDSSILGGDCNSATDQLYYYVSVSNNPSTIQVNDWVFSDINGANVLVDGYYHINQVNSQRMEIVNGVVTSLTLCP